jgi:hypothetical protein
VVDFANVWGIVAKITAWRIAEMAHGDALASAFFNASLLGQLTSSVDEITVESRGGVALS